MSIRMIPGNLIEKAGDYDVIFHGCNCFCTFGGGFAAAVRKRFPDAYQADLQTVRGDIEKLGTYTQATPDDGPTILNCYTQYFYGHLGDLFEYEAFKKVLNQIKLEFHGKKIACPKIGAGLAGGDWNRIFEIITKVMHEESLDIWYL